MDKILDCLGLGSLSSGQDAREGVMATDPSDSLQDSLAAADSTSQKDTSMDQHDQSIDQVIMETDSMNDFDNVSEMVDESSQKGSLLKRLGPVIQSEDTRLSFADNNEVILAPPESVDLRPSSSSCPPLGHKNLEEGSMDESKDSVVSSQSTSSRKRKSNADCLVIGSAMTTRSKSNDSSVGFVAVNVSFPADKLYEYEWPKGSGDHYMLQEQISEYLGIKSFKRKYPDLERRSVEMEEKQFLRDQGVVSETQCDLGLFAVKTDDIMDLISRDYPAKYSEYMKVLDRRKEANYVATKNKPAYPTGNVEKNKMNEMMKKAIKSVTSYNTELNQCRKDERRVSIDLQTYAVHYPIGLGKDNKMLKKNVATGRCLKVGKYPVATIHGQYQDWYIRYSPEELKYFPINTVLYGPIMSDAKKAKVSSKPKTGQNGGEGECSSDSDSDSYTGSEGGSSCQQEESDVHQENGQNGKQGDDDQAGEDDGASCDSCSSSQSSSSEGEDSKSSKSTSNNHDSSNKQQQSSDYAVASSLAVCKICKGSSQMNKSNAPEELVHCSDCANSVHPSCLQLTTDMADVIKSYDWQCTDCKTCVHCNKPHNEDKLMFCDICDRGYHTFCVGLRVIPTGKWVCKLCAHCAQCGTNLPGVGSKANWHHETIKIKSPNGETLRRHQLLCINCSKQRKMR